MIIRTTLRGRSFVVTGLNEISYQMVLAVVLNVVVYKKQLHPMVRLRYILINQINAAKHAPISFSCEGLSGLIF
jgi:hypothetical protein